MRSFTQSAAKWILDKWGGALISWLWNNPGFGTLTLGAAGGALVAVFRLVHKLEWIDRVLLATLVVLCLGVVLVFAKWVRQKLASAPPSAGVDSSVQAGPQLPTNQIRGIKIAAAVIVFAVLLFWPGQEKAQNLIPQTPSPAEPPIVTGQPQQHVASAPGGQAVGTITNQPLGAVSVGQQGGVTVGQLNITPQSDPNPSVPTISLSTAYGLTLTDYPGGMITPLMSRHLRRQVLIVTNDNNVNISNLTVRFQFPEPVVGDLVTDYKPAGVDVTWYPCRAQSTLVGQGASSSVDKNGITRITAQGGSSVSMFMGRDTCSPAMSGRDKKPTGTYQLQIDNVPASAAIRLAFSTTDAIHLPASHLSGGDGDALELYGKGEFQYTFANTTKTRPIFVPLQFDVAKRLLVAAATVSTPGARRLRFRSSN